MANKRDEQRKRKEEKQHSAEQKAKTLQLMTKVSLFGVLPLFALLVVYTLISQGPTYSPVEIAPNDHVRGDPATPVTIVVYADFQCPACATEHQDMTRIWPQLRERAHMVFRHFPITASHPNAWDAALYAEAAGKQDRFWEMHDYLFATQSLWSSLPDVAGEFDSYALELNLDLEKLHADIATEEMVLKVRDDQRGGNASGVLSTPAVFVNGRLLARPSDDQIIEAVTEEFNALNAGD